MSHSDSRVGLLGLIVLLAGIAVIPVRAGEELDGDLEGLIAVRAAAYRRRVFPHDRLPLKVSTPPRAFLSRMRAKAAAAVGPQAVAPNNAAPWTALGPAPIAAGQSLSGVSIPVSGRVSAILPDPTDPNVAYVGAAQGGVWKTIDGGASWRPLTDTQASLAIGALAMDPLDHQVIYAGTGEDNNSCDSYYGAGILKSTDGGATWSLKGNASLSWRTISAIAIDPTRTATVYVAAGTGFSSSKTSACTPVTGPGNAGLYKSSDGGETLSELRSLPFSGFGVDAVVVDPTGIVYAGLHEDGFGVGGIYKSTDGGTSFVRLAGGLPASGFGRTQLTLVTSTPGTLYAGFDDAGTEGRLFKTTDGGTTWVELAAAQGYCQDQCFYDMPVQADPSNPGHVFIGGQTTLARSTDGGATFNDVAVANNMHADFHAIAFNPAAPSNVWVGNDGGVWRSTDGGASWTNKNTNLAISQFQSVALDPLEPSVMIGGLQDNGTCKLAGGNWTNIRGGDGGVVLIDPTRPSTYYHAFFRSNVERSDDSGGLFSCKVGSGCSSVNDRCSFYIPLALDPSTSSTVYFGTFRVYRSTDRLDTSAVLGSGQDVTASPSDYITCLAPGTSSPNTIYAGTDEGQVQLTTDQGVTWSRIDAALPHPLRAVTSLIVDPSNAAVALLTLSGFGGGHVFLTSNSGATWTDISGDLPDLPVNQLARVSSSLLIAGTDLGMFVTRNGGTSWVSASNGFPNVSVFDVAVNTTTNRVVSATHGRGVFQAELNPRLAVLRPNGGESFSDSKTINVNFDAVEGLALEFDTYDLDLSTDSGATVAAAIAHGLPRAARTSTWTVPALGTTHARVVLTARDSAGASVMTARSAADFTIVQATPVASAGSTQRVTPSAAVILDGSSSRDPDGGTLTYLWSQTSGTTVTLSAADVARPTFTAPATRGDVLRFQLTVSDGLLSATAGTTVTVNRLPVAVAGATQRVTPSATVSLDVAGSLDPDGDPITYRWTQTSGPDVTFNATATRPQFTAPRNGRLGFELEVSDSVESSVPATTAVDVQGRAVGKFNQNGGGCSTRGAGARGTEVPSVLLWLLVLAFARSRRAPSPTAPSPPGAPRPLAGVPRPCRSERRARRHGFMQIQNPWPS